MNNCQYIIARLCSDLVNWRWSKPTYCIHYITLNPSACKYVSVVPQTHSLTPSTPLHSILWGFMLLFPQTPLKFQCSAVQWSQSLMIHQSKTLAELLVRRLSLVQRVGMFFAFLFNPPRPPNTPLKA
jgi:hypothetical protein